MPTLSPKKLCTGCLACYESCKHNAIKLYVQDGLNHITIESDKCINCKLCEQSCPIVNPIKPNKISNAIIYGNSSLKFEIMAKQLYVASQRVL